MPENIFKLIEQSHYLTVYEGSGIHKDILPQQFMIIAKSGHGKGLSSEFLAWQLWKQGYIIFVIADPKEELEFCYAMFKPEKWYHLEEMRKWGIKPENIPVKIYHPYTHRIPKGYLPDINFFTFPLRDMTEEEWSMLAESEWTSETVNLLTSACKSLSDSDGLYSFVHKIRDMVKGKRKKGKLSYDPNNFLLDSSRGTAKSLAEMSNYLDPFKIDFFLAQENSPIKINWKELLEDQGHYHVFINKWIDSQKIKHFLVMTLINQIVKNVGFAKHPVCIIISEIGKLCPENPQGYQYFLSKTIRGHLNTMRSKGRGMSSLSDSQFFEGIDENLTNSATITLIGELGGARDLEKLAKARSWNKDTKLKVANIGKKCKYIIAGHEDEGGVIIPTPPHMHKEPEYNFFEMYHKFYREKEKRYVDLIEDMRNLYKEDEDKIRLKIEKEIRERKEEEKRKNQEKEQAELKSIKKEDKSEKVKKIQSESKERLMKLCYDLKQENPEISFRKMGEKLGIHRGTAQKYHELYLKKLEESEVLMNPKNKEKENIIT